MKNNITNAIVFIKSNMRKYICAIIAMVIFCFVMSLAVMAKFIATRNTKADFMAKKVATYNMEVFGDDGITKLSERIVVNEMNPGYTFEVDFYVKNGNSEKISQVAMDYEIEVIHTLNMPLVYELYDEQGRLLTGDSYEEGTEIYLNDGSRSVYTKAADSNKLVLPVDKNDADNITSHKYTLKIIWNSDNESADFKYVKEIDFLYINVYAYQSEPIEE